MGRNEYTIKPGEVRNPNGRPKREWTWAGLIEDAMDEEDETGVPYKLIVTRRLRQMAKNGDITAIKEVFNRTDGMPKQAVDHTSKGEKIIPIFGGMSVPKHDSDAEDISTNEED